VSGKASGLRRDSALVCGAGSASALALAAAILLLCAGPSAAANADTAANADMVPEFSHTCVASKSIKALKDALAKNGWKAFPSLAASHLEREIKAVTPMLDAQGLSSDYVIYGRDARGKHLELALSETRKPVSGNRKLVGCSMYDFDATSPIDSATVSAFAPTTVGQKATTGDIQVEKWDNVFGEGSGMRAVFVPPASPMGAQLGFTGMMLGTHFLDATN
jgi:hypothetical protein